MEENFERIVRCTSLQEYADACAMHIEDPLWIMDQSFSMLAMSHHPDAAQLEKKFSHAGLIDHVAKWQKSGVLQAVAGSHVPVRLFDEDFGMNLVIMDVFSMDCAIGRLTIFERHPVKDEEVIEISLGAGVYLRTHSAVRNHDSAEQLIASLINGASASSNEITEILSSTEFSRSAHWRFLVLSTGSNRILLQALRSDLDRLKKEWVTLLQNDVIYALVPSDDSLAFLENEPCQIGSSLIFDDLAELKSYAVQARFALDHAKGKLTYFDELMPVFIPSILEEKIDLKTLIAPSVKAVMDYDEKYSTRYFETLCTYFSCNESKAKTSRTLQIHLNTVKYRLQQISQLFHIDLEKDAEKIRISLLLIDYLEHKAIREEAGK